MRFDVIIGNPPYHKRDGGSGVSSKPLYHYFILTAIKIHPKYICMIIPSRWFSGGKGLNEFRKKMLNDRRFKKIVDYELPTDCFKEVKIAGGVNYFLWDSEYSGDCEVTNILGNKKVSMKRKLNQFDYFIRRNLSISIIEKVLKKKIKMMDEIVFKRNPFGFKSKDRGSSNQFEKKVILNSSSGKSFVKKEDIKSNKNLLNKYKVIISKLIPCNGEINVNPLIGFKVTTKPRLLDKNEIHTESYLLLAVFDLKKEAENFINYWKLKTPRYLLKQTLTSMNITTKNFIFTPFLNFKLKWTDKKLYNFFKFSSKEIEEIEKTIRSF